MSPNQPLPVLIETLTDPFTVYTAKKFPGMTRKFNGKFKSKKIKIKYHLFIHYIASSSLAKSLAYQGIKVSTFFLVYLNIQKCIYLSIITFFIYLNF